MRLGFLRPQPRPEVWLQGPLQAHRLGWCFQGRSQDRIRRPVSPPTRPQGGSHDQRDQCSARPCLPPPVPKTTLDRLLFLSRLYPRLRRQPGHVPIATLRLQGKQHGLSLHPVHRRLRSLGCEALLLGAPTYGCGLARGTVRTDSRRVWPERRLAPLCLCQNLAMPGLMRPLHSTVSILFQHVRFGRLQEKFRYPEASNPTLRRQAKRPRVWHLVLLPQSLPQPKVSECLRPLCALPQVQASSQSILIGRFSNAREGLLLLRPRPVWLFLLHSMQFQHLPNARVAQ